MMMKLSILLTTVLCFAAAKTVVSSEVEGNLRGGDVHADSERELLVAGSSSKSLSFSLSSSAGTKDICFDFRSKCLELGKSFALADTFTDSEGNTKATAEADAEFSLAACCESFAFAYARTCAFTKVDGKFNVNQSVRNNLKSVSLDVTLTAATLTIALANSVAEADSFAAVDSYSYTDVDAYCKRIDQKSPHCKGSAATGLATLGVATAESKGQAGALAVSGAVSSSTACLFAQGTDIKNINGVVSAFATSFAFAQAEAVVSAFAAAFTASFSVSFSAACVKEYESVCGADPSKDICQQGSEKACAAAFAISGGFAAALSAACAEAAAGAITETFVAASLSANVDCQKTPVLTWNCTKAHADTTCKA